MQTTSSMWLPDVCIDGIEISSNDAEAKDNQASIVFSSFLQILQENRKDSRAIEQTVLRNYRKRFGAIDLAAVLAAYQEQSTEGS